MLDLLILMGVIILGYIILAPIIGIFIMAIWIGKANEKPDRWAHYR